MNRENLHIPHLADKHFRSAVNLRRTLHKYPETAFEEHKTARTLREALKKTDVRLGRFFARTGFTGLLKGNPGGRVIALRTDMDALPVHEDTGLPFASRIPGRMHACGHDVHMAVAVGTARVLSELTSSFRGAVKFIFQPAEEEPPGGAKLMIEEGVLSSPDVDAILGLHVDPAVPVGKIGIRDGLMMAGVCDVDITVRGVSGHAARPADTVDAVVTGAAMVQQLQTIISRNFDPLEPAVLTFGKIYGGSARNVISDELRLAGTMRSLTTKGMSKMKRLVTRTCKSVAKASGAKCEIEFIDGYPSLSNSKEINDLVRNASLELLGKNSVIEIEGPIMAAEDFARYLAHVPGAMFRLGIRNPKLGAVHPWHHKSFRVDEEAIRVGVIVCTKAIVDYLGC